MGLNLKAKDRKVKKIWYDNKEYIWVEGYKATENDMTCRDFQYVLNEEYFHEGEVSTCNKGFHFCPKLKDTFDYYDLDGKNRFFKVKALVCKNDWRDGYYEKYAAKKIILTEELGYENLKKYISEKYSLVKSDDDWKEIQKDGYDAFSRRIFFNRMKDSGFGEAFINIVFDECYEENMEDIVALANALKEENISKDMAVYLILQKCKED